MKGNAAAISFVIGRSGNNINAIRELTGTHIEVEKQETGVAAAKQDRTILIKGYMRMVRSWLLAATPFSYFSTSTWALLDYQMALMLFPHPPIMWEMAVADNFS